MRRVDKALLLFGFSALVAALAIGLGMIGTPGGEVSGRPVVAWVNGQPVAEVRYASTLLAMQNNLRRTLTAADRRRALGSLIDEELILQRALSLGLARGDALVRKNLIQAVVQSLGLQTKSPSEAELRDFFAREQARFKPEVQVSLQVVAADSAGAAAEFSAAVAGGAPFLEAAEAGGLEQVMLAAGLPLQQVAVRLGGSAREQVAAMQVGDIAGPLTIGSRQVFIWLLEKTSDAVEYIDVAEQVRGAWQRQAETEAIDNYLSKLRDEAFIQYQISPEQPYLK